MSESYAADRKVPTKTGTRPRVVTTKTVITMKSTGEKIAVLTAYDYEQYIFPLLAVVYTIAFFSALLGLLDGKAKSQERWQGLVGWFAKHSLR